MWFRGVWFGLVFSFVVNCCWVLLRVDCFCLVGTGFNAYYFFPSGFPVSVVILVWFDVTNSVG